MNILPGGRFSEKLFREPTNEYAVTYMWFWNVPITRELIDRELKEYARAGVRSIYIVPLPKDFRPETLRTFLDPEYLSEEFFDLAEYAIRRAREFGMKPWIYDEGGWPSGGACYNTVRENPDAVIKMLAKREVVLECDERFSPPTDHIALFDGKRRLPENYIASRKVKLTEYYVKSRLDDGNRVDNTVASVTDIFINNTYERYKKKVGDLFGDELPIIFTDEPGLFLGALAHNEFELFENEYGYDIRDFIYAIDGAGELAVTDEEIRARIDHHRLLGKLFRENTSNKLHDWCENHGVYFSGHLDIDNRTWGAMAKGYFSHIDILRKFHVPGVDVIWEQIRYPYGGRVPLDDETLGMGFFPRLASSAARLEGKNVSVTESLGIYGDGLTPDEIRYVINYQVIRGINAINFAPISIGSSRLAALMTRPNFRPEKPGFYNLKHIHEYIERLSYLARLGYAEGDTALYAPYADFAADPTSLDSASETFKSLGTALEEKNIAFDVIDDYVIREAIDTGEGLAIGGATYRYVAVPECKYMPEDVKRKIAPYLGTGAPTYTPKNDKLRFMTRKLDTGRLFFVFNEGIETVTESLSIADGRRVYRLDAANGEIYRDDSATASLPAGEIAVFYVTDEDLSCVRREVEYSVEVGEFALVGYRRFRINYSGIYNELGEGLPNDDEPFSGEISYTGKYELPYEPSAGERYRVVLEGFSVSAEVMIGRAHLTLGITPMAGIIDDSLIDKLGEMRVTVANTAVDEIYAKLNVINSHPAAEVGNYQYRMEKFEKRRPVLRFGRVRIEKLS